MLWKSFQLKEYDPFKDEKDLWDENLRENQNFARRNGYSRFNIDSLAKSIILLTI